MRNFFIEGATFWDSVDTIFLKNFLLYVRFFDFLPLFLVQSDENLGFDKSIYIDSDKSTFSF